MPFVSSGGTVVTANAPSSLFSRPLTITTYTGLSASYEAIYRSQPNVRTVVDFIARNIAGITIRTMRRVSERERRYERGHPLDQLLRRPAPGVSRFRFMRDFVSDFLVFDDAFALKANVDGHRALIRYPSRLVEPVGGLMSPSGFRLLGEAGQPVWPAENVLRLVGYNPDGTATGISPIETLRQILAEDLAATEYREQFWLRHARSAAYISRPAEAPRWTDAARDRFTASFGAAWSGLGPSAGGTPLLEDGMRLEPITQTAQESEYLGARKLSRVECASAYHVPPSSVGATEGSSYASIDADHRALYQDAFGPLFTHLAEEFLVQLLPDVSTVSADFEELELEFQIAEKLRGSFVEEAEARTRAAGGPWTTRGEIRAEAGLPPLPDDAGADELIVPLNVTTGGLASPLDTGPTSGGNTLALPTGGTKARSKVRAVPTYVDPWQARHAELIGDFMATRTPAVLTALRGGDTPAEALGLDANGRPSAWDTDLSNLLGGLALEVAAEAGGPIAETFGATYDITGAEEWLLNNARIAAEEYNRITVERVTDAFAAPASSGLRALAKELIDELELDDPDPVDLAEDALTAAGAWRATAMARDRVFGVTNFARSDAAEQSGAGTKTWLVSSGNPRASHAAMDGETVAIGETFSNGGLWPGDPGLGADEVAGCSCLVDFSR